MTRSMSGVSNGPVNVPLTLPFLPVEALGRVSANTSRPGDPDRCRDRGGTGPRTRRPRPPKSHLTTLAMARGCARWLPGSTSGQSQPPEYSARESGCDLSPGRGLLEATESLTRVRYPRPYRQRAPQDDRREPRRRCLPCGSRSADHVLESRRGTYLGLWLRQSGRAPLLRHCLL